MLHISMSLTLLALAAGMFLLLKAKAENLGNFAKAVAWIIIVCSFVMLAFDLVHHFTHGHERHEMECCRPGMCGGEGCEMKEGHGHGGMGHDACGDEHEEQEEHEHAQDTVH